MKQTVTRLSNGLSVVVFEDHFAPVVSIQMWVNVGSADEKPTQAGLAHVLEHMLFKGTPTRPVGSIAAQIEGAGGDINAFTSHDHTCYFVTMASRYFRTGLDVIADAISNSSIDEDELAKEMQVILEELARGKDTPTQKLSDACFTKAFNSHPYRRPIIGLKKVLDSIKRKYLIAFYQRHYRPSNMSLVVVGDIDTKNALKHINKRFTDFSGPKHRRPLRNTEPVQKAFRSAVLFDDIADVTCTILFHSSSLFDLDSPAIDVLAMILGSGNSSRLYQKLQEKHQTAFHVWASAYLPADPGVISTGFITDTTRFKKALEMSFDQIFSIRKNLPTTTEINKVKLMIESSLLYQLETYDGRAKNLGYSMSMAGHTNLEEQYIQRVSKVTAEQVQQAALKYLDIKNATCAVIAPKEYKENISKDILTKIAGRIYKKYETAKTKTIKNANLASYASRPMLGTFARKKRIRKVILDNGVRIIFSENPNAPVFAIRTALYGGRLYESKPGLSYFTSSLLTKGTRELNASEFAKVIDEMAGTIHGFSGLNTLGLTCEFLSKDYEKGVKLLCETLTRPAFEENQVEKMRSELLFELHRREDKLAKKSLDLLYGALYGAHPYALPTIGTGQSISQTDRKHITKFWQKTLSPQNLVLCVAGDINIDKMVSLFDKHLGKLKRKSSYSPPNPPPPPNEPIETTLHRKKEQAHIALGFLGVSNNHKDRFALAVLMSVMSGQGGRLFVDLRDKMHLAYAIQGFHMEGIGTGSIGFYIATSQRNIEIAVKALKDQVSKLVRKGITTKELQRAKRYIIGSFEIELSNNSNIAYQVALSELYGLGHLSHRHYAKKIEKVTADQVRKIATRYLDLNRSVLSIVSAR